MFGVIIFYLFKKLPTKLVVSMFRMIKMVYLLIYNETQ